MLASLLQSLRRSLSRSPQEAVPHTAVGWNDRGVALQLAGDPAQALVAFERAVAADPGLAVAQMNLGHCLLDGQRDYQRARERYKAALAIDPSLIEARKQLALVLYELGEVKEALRELAVEGLPEDPSAGQYALFMRNADPAHEARAHFEEHVGWARQHLPSGVPSRTVRTRAGPLRVGYLSGDFREHATAAFLIPVLERHNRAEFEIHCYSSNGESDVVTAKMAALVYWHDLSPLSDELAAARIREDGIDILVDLSGHTRGNRLGIVALRPAPVQASYLGYLNTTGLPCMDYRITDSQFDPPGVSESLHTETLVRIDPCCWCYRATNDNGVREASTPSDGSIRFGSFNHIAKINARVIEVWARILQALPQARLDFVGLPDAGSRERLAAAFAERGIARARLGLRPRLSGPDYLEALRNTDIALDPFPYTGGRTTCDALWEGVPVVSLAGDFGFARSGTAMLAAAGLGQLVAQGEEEYVRVAVKLASDRDAFTALRAGLRERLRASPLMDEAGLVRRLEDAYRRMLAERLLTGRRGAF